MSLSFLIKNIQKNKIYYFLFFSFLLYQLTFEIIFYYDKVLVNLDAITQFLQLENYFKFGIQTINVWPGSSVNLDEYNLFTFFLVFTDNLFFDIFNIEYTLENHISFQIIHKTFNIVLLFFLLNYIFQSKVISFLGLFLVIIDASFTHTLHNMHRYLITGLLICYWLTIYKNKKFKPFYYFLIGFIFTYSCLSIVVTGLLVGISGVIFLLYLTIKKKITIKTLILISFGSLFCLALYLNYNFYNILDYIGSTKLSAYSQDKLIYTTKYVILNIFYFIFNQHGNNFIFIYLIILFYYSSTNYLRQNEELLFKFLLIFLLVFFFIGSLIDPVHYYPSRIGILTPFVIIVILQFLYNNFILNKINSNIILFILIGNLTFVFLRGFEFNPNTFDLLLKTFLISIFLYLIFFFLINLNFLNSNKTIITIFIIAIITKFHPTYNIDKVIHMFDKTRIHFIKHSITKNINTNSCVYSNYPYKGYFQKNTVYSMLISGEHINKKFIYSSKKCDYLILIINNYSKKELNPFIKMNYVKTNKIFVDLEKNNNVFFRGNYYNIFNKVSYKNINIVYGVKNKENIKENKIIYLSQF